MKHLNVYAGTALVGRLTERDDGDMLFAYDNGWLSNSGAISLSPDLILSGREYRGTDVASFFENLLPEGDVREFIAKAKHISPGNTFGFLELLGGETAGMFSLLPEGQRPLEDPHYLPITAQDIREWFEKSHGVPLDIKGEQARMSLSGAQDKLTVFVDADGGILLPLGAAPSSHIIKPSVSHGPDLPSSAINEAFVMMVAKATQLDVPDVRYVAEMDAVLIKRYDRVMDGGKLRRLHQNDLCQVMNIPSEKKYEQEGGPSLGACFDTVMETSRQPAVDKKRLIEWVVFNVLVGNMDSHAKNLSMIATAHGMVLAPFYDMVCTSVYPNLSQKFAFKIGGENRPQWMMPRHWERFASDIKVKPKFLDGLRDDMMRRVENALQVVSVQLKTQALAPKNMEMIDTVTSRIEEQVAQMRGRMAAVDQLPDIVEKFDASQPHSNNLEQKP